MIQSSTAKRYPRHIRRALSKKHSYWKTYKKTRSLHEKGLHCYQADLCVCVCVCVVCHTPNPLVYRLIIASPSRRTTNRP